MIVLVDTAAFAEYEAVWHAAVREYARQHPVEAVFVASVVPDYSIAALYARRANVHVITRPDRAARWSPLTDPACDLDLWVFEAHGWDRAKARAWLKKDAAARARSKRAAQATALLELAEGIRLGQAPFAHAPVTVPEMPDTPGVTYRLITEGGSLSLPLGGGPLALDFETNTLDQMAAVAVGFSVSWAEGQSVYVPVRHDAGTNVSLEEARDLLRLITARPWVAHNSGFELAVLANEGITPAVWPDDTLDLCRLAGHPIGLKDAAQAVLGVTMIRYEEIAGGRPFSEVPPEAAVAYAAADADMTLRLYHRLTRECAEGTAIAPPSAFTVYTTINKPVIPILHGISRRGVAVDRDGIEAWSAGLSEATAALHEWLAAELGLTPAQFNPSSTKHLQAILFDRFGFEPLRRGVGGYSTDEDTILLLQQAAPDNAWLSMLLTYRELTKLNDTYGRGLIERLPGWGWRLHGRYSGGRTVTGRLASDTPNMQNFPTDARAFVTADAGMRFCAADYSQIELRVAAHMSGSPVLLETFRSGISPHKVTLRNVFGLTDHKANPRQYTLSKNLNFGDLYGSSAETMVKQARAGGVAISVAEMEELQAKKRRADPVLWRWVQQEREAALARGWADTLQGRRNYNRDVFSKDSAVQQEGVRMLVNSRIQGTASLIAIEAMVEWEQRGFNARWPLAIQIHDDLTVQAPEGDAPAALDTLAAVMREAGARWVTSCPIEVEGKVGATWKGLK